MGIVETVLVAQRHVQQNMTHQTLKLFMRYLDLMKQSSDQTSVRLDQLGCIMRPNWNKTVKTMSRL